jgi:hypothetical protein
MSECIFCKIPLSKLHLDTNDLYCVNCPYNYIHYSGLVYEYWNFYVGEYYVWVRAYDSSYATSHICRADYKIEHAVINTAIKPCSLEKLKLYILFS